MKILYFAQIKESIGKDQDIIEFKSEISINELIEELISKGEKYKKSFKWGYGPPIDTLTSEIFMIIFN